jgi:hypothetical protein
MEGIESYLPDNVNEFVAFARKRLSIRMLPPTRCKKACSTHSEQRIRFGMKNKGDAKGPNLLSRSCVQCNCMPDHASARYMILGG